MLQWWAGSLEPGSSESRRHGDSRRRLGVRLRPNSLLVLVIALLLGRSPGGVATSRPTVAEPHHERARGRNYVDENSY